MSNVKYIPKKMIKNSRYRKLFPTLNDSIQLRTYEIMTEKINDCKEYCDKGNYSHMCNLLSATCIYLSLMENGTCKDDAFKIVSTSMWSYVENTTGKKYRKLFKMPFAFNILGKLIPSFFSKGCGYGWKYVFHSDESKNVIKFECEECIYAKLFKKFNVPELGPMFCHADDINYGNLTNIKFTRNHTLCKDSQPCDFHFTKEK